MAGYKRKARDGDEFIEGGASIHQRLQWLERDEANRRGDPSWRLETQVFKLIEKLAIDGAELVRTFHWFKDLLVVTQHRDSGRMIFHYSKPFYAERLFQFLGSDLLRSFKTRNMETRVGGHTIRHFGGGGEKEAMPSHLKQSLSSAIAALGDAPQGRLASHG